MSTLTLYPGYVPFGTVHGSVECERSYNESERLVRSGKTFATTQMAILEDPHVCDYDLIDIRDDRRRVVIRNNHDGTWFCDSTDRELRHGHNLFRLWKGGEFYVRA